jgi:hypothetical protein
VPTGLAPDNNSSIGALFYGRAIDGWLMWSQGKGDHDMTTYTVKQIVTNQKTGQIAVIHRIHDGGAWISWCYQKDGKPFGASRCSKIAAFDKLFAPR